MGSEHHLDLDTAYDEDRDADGCERPGYEALLRALEGSDLEAVHAAVTGALERDRALFGGEVFTADAIPRLICAAEWEPLAAGLAQRARALNRFLLDAYGEQRIIAEGLIDADTITEAEGFEPDLAGRLPAYAAPAAVIGFDVVRDPSGEFLVLEDNVRTPSGYSYALAMRAALLAILPDAGLKPRPIEPVTYELLRRTLVAAAPAGVSDPHIVVLTDGPDNVAYYEHAQAAERTGATLAQLEDLSAADGRLLHHGRGGAGSPEPVDVVYRRTNEDRARDERGELTPVAALLLEPWLSGRLGLVNAFGNGLADDKLVHAHVEDFVRFYLGEEPLVRSLPTTALSAEPDRGRAVARLRRLVVKPRHGHGGIGVVIGAHAETDDLERLATELSERPEHYISQPIVPLSRHPTIIDGRLQHRHVDLRPFVFSIAEDVELMPGGLSRVALESGSLVVNSSQDGGGKDTWVIP
jgi:uncharacterized circularly permuted ATP-grasp superfamily protein